MLRLAIVGLGAWGRVLVDAIPPEATNMRFVVAVVRRPDAARGFCAPRGIEVTTDLAGVLANSAIDAVVLCTPHGQHYEQLLACAQAGKPVFCEKPLTMRRAEAVHAVQACQRAGVVLGIGHERRFEPPVLALGRMLASGELGTPMHLEANFSHDILTREGEGSWRLAAGDAPAAGLTGPAIHMLDRAVSLFGRVETIYAQCVQAGTAMPQGDTLSVLLRFANGRTGYVGSLIATPFVSRFQVFGTQGSVEISDRAWVDRPAGWDVVLRRPGGAEPERSFVPPATPILDNLEAFAAAVRGEAAYPVQAEDLIQTVACVEAVVASCRSAAPVRPADLAA